jgi:hypothetical protein
MRQSRVRQKAGNLTGGSSENDFITTASSLYSYFSFENYREIVKRFTFATQDFSRLEMRFLKMFCQPLELFWGQVFEDLYPAQIVD